jgi:hypothetical protein
MARSRLSRATRSIERKTNDTIAQATTTLRQRLRSLASSSRHLLFGAARARPGSRRCAHHQRTIELFAHSVATTARVTDRSGPLTERAIGATPDGRGSVLTLALATVRIPSGDSRPASCYVRRGYRAGPLRPAHSRSGRSAIGPGIRDAAQLMWLFRRAREPR